MSDSQRPHGLQPTRLLHPWDFPDKSTGVGCHCLLQRLEQGISKQRTLRTARGLQKLGEPTEEFFPRAHRGNAYSIARILMLDFWSPKCRTIWFFYIQPSSMWRLVRAGTKTHGKKDQLWTTILGSNLYRVFWTMATCLISLSINLLACEILRASVKSQVHNRKITKELYDFYQ